MRNARHWMKPFLDLVFPLRCLVCGEELGGDVGLRLCRSCARGVHEVRDPVCPACGQPLPSPELLEIHPGFRCGACRIDPHRYARAWVLFYFEDSMRELIHRFKYQGRSRLGRRLIQQCRGRIERIDDTFDMVLPVPLSPLRLRIRGFNQSTLLAREVAGILDLPLVVDLLVRKRGGRRQVGLRGAARRRNVRGRFAASKPERIRNRKVLLVDDVVTTGATADECARLLRRSGAKEVSLLALAGAFSASRERFNRDRTF